MERLFLQARLKRKIDLQEWKEDLEEFEIINIDKQ
jgi:hypothetical protein